MEGQNSKSSGNRQLLKQVFSRVLLAVIVLGLLFFFPAGTFNYWQAWIYCGTLFIPMIIIMIYLLRNNPELLERRLKMKEKERPQKLIFKLGIVFLFLAFIIPGVDFRFKWSYVPIAVVIFTDVIFLVGYLLFFLVLKTNTFASRIIEVEKEQRVISTGLYAIIRHPMYLAVLLMYCSSPLALGSYWAMLAIIPFPILIVFRIINEEKVLIKELPDYKEYLQKTKYRLIPFLW